MSENVGLIVMVIAAIIGATIGTILVRRVSAASSEERVLSRSIAYGQVRVWTDPETGCQYLRAGGRLTPRLNSSGAAICRKPNI